ncbi:lasso RiPP family leader peptide-containing protein [Nonomuraea sp. NPDC050790]|uniref:lasso RiPP family leader peptide-containing protein n=1 Tax=Nonomuraea sp. NPDC050790 TaxID=3364371 RepID=UPI0037BD795C
MAEAETTPDFGEPGQAAYEPPLLIRLGRVGDLTLGSSSSGKSDANSQYYW